MNLKGNKIIVNLLPAEFLAEEGKKAKFFKVQQIGVGIVLLMIFLSSLTVVLRVLQSQNISQIQTRISRAEEEVSELKDKQATLLLLKNRLTTISKFLGKGSKQIEVYALLDKLLTDKVSVSSMSVDSAGNVALVATIADTNTLDNMISTLTNKEANQGKIGAVSIESLNRGRDNLYRLSLKLESK